MKIAFPPPSVQKTPASVRFGQQTASTNIPDDALRQAVENFIQKTAAPELCEALLSCQAGERKTRHVQPLMAALNAASQEQRQALATWIRTQLDSVDRLTGPAWRAVDCLVTQQERAL